MHEHDGAAFMISDEDRCEPDLVHNANGALAARLGIRCYVALNRMRRYANRTERPLPEIAKAVLDRSIDLSDEPERPEPGGSR